MAEPAGELIRPLATETDVTRRSTISSIRTRATGQKIRARPSEQQVVPGHS